MAGAIIENMSTKKLVIVGVILLLFQAFAFMVGGLIVLPLMSFLCEGPRAQSTFSADFLLPKSPSASAFASSLPQPEPHSCQGSESPQDRSGEAVNVL